MLCLHCSQLHLKTLRLCESNCEWIIGRDFEWIIRRNLEWVVQRRINLGWVVQGLLDVEWVTQRLFNFRFLWFFSSRFRLGWSRLVSLKFFFFSEWPVLLITLSNRRCVCQGGIDLSRELIYVTLEVFIIGLCIFELHSDLLDVLICLLMQVNRSVESDFVDLIHHFIIRFLIGSKVKRKRFDNSLLFSQLLSETRDHLSVLIGHRRFDCENVKIQGHDSLLNFLALFVEDRFEPCLFRKTLD